MLIEALYRSIIDDVMVSLGEQLSKEQLDALESAWMHELEAIGLVEDPSEYCLPDEEAETAPAQLEGEAQAAGKHQAHVEGVMGGSAESRAGSLAMMSGKAFYGVDGELVEQFAVENFGHKIVAEQITEQTEKTVDEPLRPEVAVERFPSETQLPKASAKTPVAVSPRMPDLTAEEMITTPLTLPDIRDFEINYISGWYQGQVRSSDQAHGEENKVRFRMNMLGCIARVKRKEFFIPRCSISIDF